jgi:hypothetical protein
LRTWRSSPSTRYACAADRSNARRTTTAARSWTACRSKARGAQFRFDDGGALFEQTLRHGYEGIVAKCRRSIYHPGVRTRDWMKTKHWKLQASLIGGWSPSRPRHGWDCSWVRSTSAASVDNADESNSTSRPMSVPCWMASSHRSPVKPRRSAHASTSPMPCTWSRSSPPRCGTWNGRRRDVYDTRRSDRSADGGIIRQYRS